MGRKRTASLIKRGKVWYVEKRLLGGRIRESTGSELLCDAEGYLARQIEEVRQAKVYGVRPKRTFREAATKYLVESQHKASIRDDADHLRLVCRYIGDLICDQLLFLQLLTTFRYKILF